MLGESNPVESPSPPEADLIEFLLSKLFLYKEDVCDNCGYEFRDYLKSKELQNERQY